MSRLRRFVTALGVLLFLGRATVAPGDAPTAKLAVIVAVDGLSWHRLSTYRPWFVAGFKRLLDEGVVHTSCHYRHLNTETGPGHASLGAGAPPRVTGIVANRWFEAQSDGSLRSVYCTDQASPGGASGAAPIPGPANLRVPTLGDRLVGIHAGARVFALAGKDRAAIFMAGKDPRHVVYWFDRVNGRFVTSPAYDPGTPLAASAQSLVGRFNGTRAGAALQARVGVLWKKLPAPPAVRGTPQPAEGLADFQIPVNGLGFDHDLSSHRSGYIGGVYVSPLLDELVADLAVDFIDDDGIRLGRGPQPDLLALSFSAQDTVSHNYGPESEENLDVLRRLDVQIGRVLDALDRRIGKDRVILGLSADHGFLPIPEAEKLRNPSFTGGRLVQGPRVLTGFLDRLNRLIDEDLGVSAACQPIYASEGWGLVYNAPAFRTPGCAHSGQPITSADIDRVLPALVTRFFKEEIESVLLVSQRDTWSADSPASEFARNDLDPGRSGEAFLVPRPGVLNHWDPGRGSGHGSHHEPETHVPLVFWGGGLAPRTSGVETTPYDLARTLADYLQVPVPDAVGVSRRPRH